MTRINDVRRYKGILYETPTKLPNLPEGYYWQLASTEPRFSQGIKERGTNLAVMSEEGIPYNSCADDYTIPRELATTRQIRGAAKMILNRKSRWYREAA